MSEATCEIYIDQDFVIYSNLFKFIQIYSNLFKFIQMSNKMPIFTIYEVKETYVRWGLECGEAYMDKIVTELTTQGCLRCPCGDVVPPTVTTYSHALWVHAICILFQ
jgi:hypothetical protein